MVADEVTDAVVDIVSEMTGYPRELLDLDLDLEADLGVDTVKQAEVFAAVRARFGVERDDNLALREFPTLAHVIGWIRAKTGIAAPGAAPPAATAAAAEPVAPAAAEPVAPAPREPVVAEPVVAEPVVVADEVADAVVDIVSEMTGYPRELLDLDLDLEADLGVDTVKQAEVFAAVRARFGVERDDNLALREFPTLAHVIGWIRAKTGIAAPGAARRPPAAPPSRGARCRRTGGASAGCGAGRCGAGGGGRRGDRCGGGHRVRDDRLPTLSCWTWTWIWRPTWGWTRSSRPRCSLRCGPGSGSNATTTWRCGSSRPWPT